MEEFKAQRAEREHTLALLTSTPFDPNNTAHQDALKKYITAFELSVHLKNIQELLRSSIKTWCSSLIISRLIPLPDFARYCLNTFLCLGIGAIIIERCSRTDYYQQLEEMEALYHWCLKAPGIDHDRSLASPPVQQLTTLLAPLCNTEFMVSWPKTNEASTTVVNTGYASLKSTLFALIATQQSKVDKDKIRDLKIKVETGGFNVGAAKKLEQSINYFKDNHAYVRTIFYTELKNLLAQEFNPASVLGFISYP
jgi:hypothetical protein